MEKKKLCVASLILVGAMSLGAYGGANLMPNPFGADGASSARVMELFNQKMNKAKKELEQHSQAKLNESLDANIDINELSIEQTKAMYMESISHMIMKEAKADATAEFDKNKDKLNNANKMVGGATGGMAGLGLGLAAYLSLLGKARRKEEEKQYLKICEQMKKQNATGIIDLN